MTSTCPHCGGQIFPGQPLCTDCGKSVAAGQSAAAGTADPATRRPLKRDKGKDFERLGQTIAGKYKILDVLGQGGFGTVYLVEIMAGMVGEKLALKLLPAELSKDNVIRDQFVNEIRVAMRMVDKYIVQIRDVGTTDDGLLYYTMDFCPGTTLAEVLRRERRLAIPRTLMLSRKVLRALQTAHGLDIIHRDLKTANIMVQGEGNRESVRVLDFGIATAIRSSADQKNKGFVGSPFYMPPEQFLGEPMGYYTDLYSVGVVLYECITGRKPYTGKTPQEVFRNLKRGEIAPPQTLTPDVELYPGLTALMLKALERNPQRRFQTAKEFFEAVNAVLSGNPPPELYTLPDADHVSAAASQRAARLATRRAASEPAPPAPPRVSHETAARIRKRRVARSQSRRHTERALSLGLGLLLIAAVALGVIYNKRIIAWFAGGNRISKDSQETTRSGSEKKRAHTSPRKPDGKDRSETSGASKQEDERQDDIDVRREAAEAEFAAWLERSVSELASAAQNKLWNDVSQKAETILNQAPDSVEAQRWRGIAAFHLGEHSVAADFLSRVVGAEGSTEVSTETLFVLGRAQTHQEDWPGVENTMQRALRLNPKNAEAIFLLGQALEKQGKRTRLERLLGAARRGKVSSPDLDALCERVLVEEPRKLLEDAERLLEEAKAALAIGDGATATARASEASELLPSREVDLVTAEGFLFQGDLESSLRMLDSVKASLQAAEAPSEPDAASALAFERGKEFELRARSHVTRFLQSGKGDELGEAQIAFDQALAQTNAMDRRIRKAVAAQIRLWRSHVHALRGDFDLVLEDMKPSLDAHAPILLAQQARIFQKAGDEARRREHRLEAYAMASGRWSRLLKADGLPNALSLEALFQRGSCQLQIGNLRESRSYFKQAVNSFLKAEQAGLQTAELYLLWAASYEKIGQPKSAAEKYGRLFEIEPTAANCLRAANAHIGANPRGDKGIQLLREGITKFPGDKALKQRYLEVTGQAR